MSNTGTVWLVIIVLVIIAGGWFFFAYGGTLPGMPQAATTTNSGGSGGTQTQNSGTGAGGSDVNVNISVGEAPSSASVIYTSNGFSPSPVTIKVGGTVTFANQSGAQMWVASAQHPIHSAYSGTTLQQHCDTLSNDSFDQCEAGNSYSFTFDKVGTWNYHNHLRSSDFGQVIVVE